MASGSRSIHHIQPNTVNSSRKTQRRGSLGGEPIDSKGLSVWHSFSYPLPTLAQLWRQLRRARRRHISMKKKLKKLSCLLCNSHLFIGMATRQRL